MLAFLQTNLVISCDMFAINFTSCSILSYFYPQYEGTGLLDAFNAEALKLALMGVTISVASGELV